MCDRFCTDDERLSTESLACEKMNQSSREKNSESVLTIIDSTIDEVLDCKQEYYQFVDNNKNHHPNESKFDCHSINVENADDDDDDECNTTNGEIGIDRDDEEYDNNSEDGDWCNNDNSYNDELFLLTKPIIVGYAFGPKKMSTMGVVMAEASKTRISASHAARTEPTTTAPTPTSLSVSLDCTVNDYNKQSGIQHPNDCEHSFNSNDSIEDCNNELSVGECLNTSEQRHLCKFNSSSTEDRSMSCLQSANQDTHCNNPSMEQQTTPRRNKRLLHRRPVDECVTFTIDGRMINYSATATTQGLHHPYEGNSKNTSFRNIVRRFRSSCSSTGSDENENDDSYDDASSSATGTCTASMGSSSQLTSGTTTALASNSSSTRRNRLNIENHFPVRVSFVPLDPDSPLEEQHGGKLDVILHKLTEDILYLSQLSSKSIELRKNIEHRDLSNIQLDTLNNCNIDEMAVRRVLRVCHFRTAYPECCIVDDPGRVITLMSRADISKTLQQCLHGVTSSSGIIVESPKFHVVDDYTTSLDDCKNKISNNTLQQLSYPIIVKPLCAAGTKASHAMTVIMKPSILQQIITEKAPCILQEYHNHDAFLYKVYILGDHVSVHKRRSLPNLPHWKNQEHVIDYVEFDSQRPYPRLSEFGYDESIDDSKYDDTATTTASTTTTTISGCQSTTSSNVTVEEILPVVNAIRAAFGLQLFGFDVLITTSCNTASRTDVCYEHFSEQSSVLVLQKRMLVIDVNYFPSYKEVTNFPALLAKYLTDQVLDSRRKMIAAKEI